MSADLDLPKIETWAHDLLDAFRDDKADWALNLVIAIKELDGRSPVTTILALVSELETCHAILRAKGWDDPSFT